jgi:hypothetical protein
LAGSFYHLILAQKAAPLAFPEPGQRSDAVLTSFAAGVVAPDLGFFPDGPTSFSHRVHHESTGDFVGALVAGADSPEDQAFAKGWALHVLTDIAIHPFINAEADRRGISGTKKDRSQLWHKKLEWGFDCHVLSSEQVAGIDVRVDALKQTDPSSAFLMAAAQMYGGDASQLGIRRGWTSMVCWVARIMRILLWTGSFTWPQSGFPIRLCSRPLKPLTRGVGKLLEVHEALYDAAAVARPHVPDAGFIETMTGLGNSALERYGEVVAAGLSNLPNLDLDTGQEIDRGPSND